MVHCFTWSFIWLTIVSSSSQQYRTCPTGVRYQKHDADFIVAGFTPVHVWDSSSNVFKFNTAGMVWASAISFAIHEINRNTLLLPGIKLGFDIRDSCDIPAVAIQESLDIMLDTQYLRPIFNISEYKNKLCIFKNDTNSIIAGVIGGASSPLSAALSNLLGTDFIPQISYSSTSTALSDRRYYRNFARTIPSDIFQAEAIADLLKELNWTYVSAFASDDDYGRLGLYELQLRTEERGICLAAESTFNPSPSQTEIDDIISHLKTFNNSSHVVILWCQKAVALRILKTAKLDNLSNISWIGTETWGTDPNVQFNLDGIIIGLEVLQPDIPSFTRFFQETGSFYSLKLCDSPWIDEYFITSFGFDCETALAFGEGSGFMRVLRINKHAQVIGAVYSLAHALHKTFSCSSNKCSAPNGKLDYEAVYNMIMLQNFTVPNSTFRVEFDKYGDSLIKHYQFKLFNSRLKSDGFISFGGWTGSGQLHVNKSLLNWTKVMSVVSRCSEECLPGFYKVDGAIQCCWSCAPCPYDQISTAYNQKECVPCRTTTQVANTNRTRCIDLDNVYLKYASLAGILIILASCIGVILTIAVFIIFLVYWDTPIIKSSSREMSCLQLASLMLLFCTPTVYFLDSSFPVCLLRIVLFGFSLTTVIAIIVTKTYRLHRVFNERFTKVSRFLHNKYQILFSFLIVLILVPAVILFNIFLPQDIHIERDTLAKTVYTQCSKSDDILLWVVLSYCFVLALASGYVCFHARKLPENFNETQYISFAMFTLCILWLMFIPLFASLHGLELTIAFLTINYVSTLSILLILYGYKVRIILFLPQYNSPEHFRKTAVNTTIAHFQREALGGKRRYQSVVMFDYVDNSPPRKRFNTALSDLEVPHLHDLKRPPLTRSASFGGLGKRESKAYSQLNLDMLLQSTDSRAPKKSQSTPMLLDVIDDDYDVRKSRQSASLWRPVSLVFERVMSATSLNKILNENKIQTSVERKGLLDKESIV